MSAVLAEGRDGRRFATALARWPTGAKLFVILSIALSPFALIAVLAGMQSTRIADAELRSQLRVAANEGTRALGIELIGDMTALRAAVNALEADPADTPSCARAKGVFADQLGGGVRFSITDRNDAVICGNAGMNALPVILPPDSGAVAASIDPDRGLMLAIKSASGRLAARVMFPAAMLAQIARPVGFASPYAATLTQGGDRLVLQDLPAGSPFNGTQAVAMPLGIGGLTFEMALRNVPISSPMVVAMLLPILMWIAAAGLSWFVVDHQLIRPLQELRRRVAAYQPGEELDPGAVRTIPAQEIRELGETFRTLSLTVIEREAELAEGLIRQTKLTREVHHRVKNNLQVISSLINFHARGARSADATTAYGGIQRRVDALAVVHRNHFAEIEQSRGVGLRSVIGDLASNIRATAPEGADFTIIVDADPFLATQDVATAIAFLLTELIELSLTIQTDAAIRISLKEAKEGSDDAGKAVLRISAPSLIDSDRLRDEMATRYGRVVEGLSRQLRSRIHHDPLVGAYEIAVAVTGRD